MRKPRREYFDYFSDGFLLILPYITVKKLDDGEPIWDSVWRAAAAGGAEVRGS